MSRALGTDSSAGSRSVMIRAVSSAALERRVEGPGERHTAEPLGDRARLALAALGERAVRHAVLGILLLAVADEVEVVRHGSWFLVDD